MNVLKTYRFKDKDPVIDQLRTALKDSGMSYRELADGSGVTVQTLYNWFDGSTKRPQFATAMAVARALGMDFKLVRSNFHARRGNVVALRR